ncbi:MAG TPA: outer membrane beta-barrel protein, partial [Sphingobium sp.]
MRKLALAAALATTVLATPAFARDKSWYIGADAGAMIVEDTTLKVVTPNSKVNYNTGYDVDGVIGYDFGGFRLETEVGYRRAYTDSNVYANGIQSTRGNFRTLNFMVNGLLDFGPDDGLQGFVGGGVGVARTYLYTLTTDDSDTGFAWQALAGIRFPITSKLDASLKYRFFNHGDIGVVTSNALGGVPAGSDVDARIRTHSILAGLTYNFGEPAAPPPPPPPPPP